MNVNLLFHVESINWEDLSIDRSECFDNIQLIIGKSQENGHQRFKPNSFDDLIFSWGEISKLFESETLSTLNAKWLEPYVWGGTFAIIYAFRPSPMQANNLQELKLEFPNHCNALLGCDSSKDEVVYDINSYKAIQVEFNRPKLKLPANQINDLIDTHYKHIFERLDVPTTIDTGNLFNEQIQIHLNSGRTKNIGALNIDGTWKHKPEKQRHQTLIKEAKEILLDWGFRLPIE